MPVSPAVPHEPSRRQSAYQYHAAPPNGSPIHNPYTQYPLAHNGTHAPYFQPPQWYQFPQQQPLPQWQHHGAPPRQQFMPAMPPNIPQSMQHPQQHPSLPQHQHQNQFPYPQQHPHYQLPHHQALHHHQQHPQFYVQHQGPLIVSSSPHALHMSQATRLNDNSFSVDQTRAAEQPLLATAPVYQASKPRPEAHNVPSPSPSHASSAKAENNQAAERLKAASGDVVTAPGPVMATVPISTPSASSDISFPLDTNVTSPNRVSPQESTSLRPPSRYVPKYPQLPWLSSPDKTFPSRNSRTRLRRYRGGHAGPALVLPALPYHDGSVPSTSSTFDSDQATVSQADHDTGAQKQKAQGTVTSSELETPITSEAPSEADSTHPTTPSSIPPGQQLTPRPVSNARNANKPVIPAVPRLPVTGFGLAASKPSTSATTLDIDSTPHTTDVHKSLAPVQPSTADAIVTGTDDGDLAPAATPAAPPSSWAALFQAKNSTGSGQKVASVSASTGDTAAFVASLVNVLRSYDVNSMSKFVFFEPRGLKNTGNMCYMNSILQVLIFCVPFYNFLDQVGKQSTHSFKTDTPLLDALINFTREFRVIDSANTIEQLRLRLKDNELEQYGSGFSPDSVYDVIRRLPRFSSMRRGHQQDAEEFLGFLLAGLHDECAQLLGPTPDSTTNSEPLSPQSQTSTTVGDGWLEVGPKQKAAVTRTSGYVNLDSPITKIFGGHLRSELRVPGSKNSVTLEPYQPLQLDIGAPNVNNIVDALKNLTKPEAIQGDWKSARGSSTSATKQVFIDTLPPVLILHLKRFQYNNTGGTQKIWKKVGYPLELDIPKEVFPTSKRNKLTLSGALPKYRLMSVVYHHGTSAAGGHYTVDVRRQEGREWVRIDDLYIRRVRSEDVAEAGAEEDPKVLAAALESHKDELRSGNIFDSFDVGEEGEGEEGWNQVNGTSTQGSNTPHTGKKWSAVANGTTSTGTATPVTKGQQTPKGRLEAGGKVAYILIYEQIK